MSDSFAGLTRRVSNLIHEQETAEELSYLVDEAKEVGGDAADAIIELALGEEHIDSDVYDDNDSDEEYEAVVEDDDYCGDDSDCDDDDQDDDSDISDEEIDDELDSLEDDSDEDNSELNESVILGHEVFVL